MRPCVPQSQEGEKVGPPSNGELRRWLNNGSVLINGVKPKPSDRIEYPVTQLVYFPKNPNKRTTVW